MQIAADLTYRHIAALRTELYGPLEASLQSIAGQPSTGRLSELVRKHNGFVTKLAKDLSDDGYLEFLMGEKNGSI